MATAPRSTPPASPAEPCFEDCLQNLEGIVAALEAGEKPLDESLALYEKGVAALKRCHELLDKAEQRIRLLVRAPDGSPVLRDAQLEGTGTPLAAGSSRSTAKIHPAAQAASRPARDADGSEVEAASGTEPLHESPEAAAPPASLAPPASPARPVSDKRGGRPPARRGGDSARSLFRG